MVGHEGTDPAKILSIANDAEIKQVAMNSTLFKNVAGNLPLQRRVVDCLFNLGCDTDGVLVHDGFQDTQGRTADIVLSTVQSALSSSGFKRVLVTGLYITRSFHIIAHDILC